MRKEFDIVIVGGGGSGLAAAVSAAEHGAEVLVLEKYPECGGSTGIAVGSFTANQTSFQAAEGIEDSAEAHAEDAALFAPEEIEARNNDELRAWFLEHGAETLDWLQGMGLNFYGPSPEPPNRVPRMHNVVPGAKAYITVLLARFIKLGATVQTNARVLELIVEDRRVTGVVAEVESQRKEFAARKGVVLAAGDYTNSPEMIARFKGPEFAHIEGISERALGEGHLLAEKVGARLMNMDVTYGPELRFVTPAKKTFQQLVPTRGPLAKIIGAMVPFVPQFLMTMMIKRLLVTWQHPEDSMLESGALLVNQDGKRFCDEKVSPAREIAVANQPGKYAYMLLDRNLIEKFSAWPNFISTAQEIGYAYVDDYLRLRPDVTVKGETLAEVAGKRGIPAEKLAQAAAEGGLSEGPWVLMGPAKAYFTNTEGGVAINTRFEALDEDGTQIPGLYAIGQNGLSGLVLWGHGLHINWAMTSGRMVGKQLAKE